MSNPNTEPQDTEVKQEFKVIGVELITKVVRSGNASSSRINMPPDWQGKRVVIIRQE